MMYYIALVIFILVLLGSMMLGGSPAMFIDLPSLLMITLITLPMFMASGLSKDLGRAFQILIYQKKTYAKAELGRSLEAVTLIIKLLILSGIFGFLTGMISFARQLSDLSQIGPAFSVMLLTTYYALFSILIFLPVQARIKALLHEKSSEE